LIAVRRARERLGRACRGGACAQQLADDPVDGSVEVGADLVDEPDSQCRLGVEPLARDEVPPGRARADLGERER
jgi:hypothetical protein